jgi:hypothetical protein
MDEEIIILECPYCRKQVGIVWNHGVVSKPEYVLIADWVYHSECWDKLVEENPP